MTNHTQDMQGLSGHSPLTTSISHSTKQDREHEREKFILAYLPRLCNLLKLPAVCCTLSISAPQKCNSTWAKLGREPRNHNVQLQALTMKPTFPLLSDQKYEITVAWYPLIPAKYYSKVYDVPWENERPYRFITLHHSGKSRAQDVSFRIRPASTFRHCTSRYPHHRAEVLTCRSISLLKDVQTSVPKDSELKHF